MVTQYAMSEPAKKASGKETPGMQINRIPKPSPGPDEDDNR